MWMRGRRRDATLMIINGFRLESLRPPTGCREERAVDGPEDTGETSCLFRPCPVRDCRRLGFPVENWRLNSFPASRGGQKGPA